MIPLRYNIRNLAVRKTTSAAAVLGLALVVFIFAAVQMLSAGIKRTLGRSASGDGDGALVLRKGSSAEIESTIEEPNVNLVINDSTLPAPAEGRARGVAELVAVILLDKVGAAGISNVAVRGTTSGSQEFRPSFKIVAGRAPAPGADEAIVGQAIRGRLKGLEMDQSFELRKNRPLKIVGVFSDGGSANESEVWTDIDNARTAFKREGMVSSIRVRVPPEKFETFKASIESNRQLNLQALRETAYYEKQSEGISLFITIMGTMIALLFSVGAMLGAMITMHAAVAARQREIGTLRALGFGRGSILLAFLIESIILALIAGGIGTIASLAMGQVRFPMVNWASFSEVVFTFEPTPQIIVGSFVFATIMGILGGFFPAVRAARVSPVDAMRT
jgi:putative ABC transport system permease protein